MQVTVKGTGEITCPLCSFDKAAESSRPSQGSRRSSFLAIPGMSECHCEEGWIAFVFSQSGLEAETFQGRRVFRRDGIAVVMDHDLGELM